MDWDQMAAEFAEQLPHPEYENNAASPLAAQRKMARLMIVNGAKWQRIMISDYKAVEGLARAHYETYIDAEENPWDELSVARRETLKERMRLAISALFGEEP